MREITVFVVMLLAVLYWPIPSVSAQEKAPAAVPAEKLISHGKMVTLPPPALVETQKLTLKNALLAVQLAQAQARPYLEAADKSQKELQRLIVAMTPAGYEITDDYELRLKPEKKAEPKPVEAPAAEKKD